MCSGGRIGRARLRATLAQRGYSQDAAYEATLPPGPFKKRRRAPEQNFHRQVAQYLSKALPKGFLWSTFPSGGGGRIRGAQLKAMGLRPGMPDIVIFGAEQPWACPKICWLELKSKSGALSAVQKATIAELKALGHEVAVCRTLEEMEAAAAEFVAPEKLRCRVTV
jgi:hypothetical protein